MKRVLLMAAAAMLATSTASAQTLLADNFDSENGGAGTVLNYASFGNWNVAGTVDLIRSGDFGISCFGNSGSCVDLDGSQNAAGTLTSKTAFSFNAGDLVGITFMASGNQRTSASDLLQFTLNFTTSTTFSSYAANLGGTEFGSNAPLFVGFGYGTGRNLAGNEGWGAWTFQFIAQNAGSFTLDIGTTGTDNIGPILDNVSVGRSPADNVVPEPATWTLMLGGLGLLGVAARKRRAA